MASILGIGVNQDRALILAHDSPFTRAQIANARALGPGFVDQLEQAHLFRIANGEVRNELHTGNFSSAVIGGRPYVANLDPETLFDSTTLGLPFPSSDSFRAKCSLPPIKSN